MTKTRDPLEPTATWLYVVATMVAVFLGLNVVGAIFWSGSLLGFGDPSTCVEVRSGRVPVPVAELDVVMGELDGVTSQPSTVLMCAESPTAWQRLLGELRRLPTLLVLLGTLLLAVRLVRGATREELFTTVTAARLRTLGWFVLAGGFVAWLLESQSRNWLVNTMVTDEYVRFVGDDWDIPVTALFLGAVLVSMGRIMRLSAEMRDELEGTV